MPSSPFSRDFFWHPSLLMHEYHCAVLNFPVFGSEQPNCLHPLLHLVPSNMNASCSAEYTLVLCVTANKNVQLWCTVLYEMQNTKKTLLNGIELDWILLIWGLFSEFAEDEIASSIWIARLEKDEGCSLHAARSYSWASWSTCERAAVTYWEENSCWWESCCRVALWWEMVGSQA